MATSDLAVLAQQQQNATEHVVKQLRIITILLRQGFNLPDEDASLTYQTPPTSIS